jgi:hypothetical protein
MFVARVRRRRFMVPYRINRKRQRGEVPGRSRIEPLRRTSAVLMRLVAFSLLVTMGLLSRGLAEERVIVLPEIVIGPGAGGIAKPGNGTNAGGVTSAPTGPDRCVDVPTGSNRAIDCLNQKLKREVDRVNPTLNLPPIDARSPDTKTGVVNIPGVQQQYGKNFGVSVVPYRPPSPTFAAPGHR